MKVSYVFLMALATLVMLEGKWTSAAPSPQSEDVLKTLLKLDRMYSAVARPRFGKRGRDDANFSGFDYEHQEYDKEDPNRKIGSSIPTKYIFDLDPVYR